MRRIWHRHWRRYSRRGATLAELLTCLAVLAILAALAFPSWQRLQARQQVMLAADRLAGSLALARSAAVARRSDVILTPLPGASSLDHGWRLALAPGGEPGQDDAGLLAVVEAQRLPAHCPALHHARQQYAAHDSCGILSLRARRVPRCHLHRFLPGRTAAAKAQCSRPRPSVHAGAGCRLR